MQTALLSFPLTHSAWYPVPSSSSLSSASSTTCSTPLPSTCLYLSLASPISLQAYTPCQLFLLLSHSDLTGEHSCPATIPPHSLFCLRLFPLSSSAALLLPLPPPSVRLFSSPPGNVIFLVTSLSISNMFLFRFSPSTTEKVIYF